MTQTTNEGTTTTTADTNSEATAVADNAPAPVAADNANSDVANKVEGTDSVHQNQNAQAEGKTDQVEKTEEQKKEFDIVLSEDSIFSERKGDLVKVLKEVGIDSQEKFEKLSNFIKEHGEKANAFIAQKAEKETERLINETLTGWDNALKNDKEFGLKYDENVKMVKDTIKGLGADFQGFMEKNGYDRNPVVAKAFLKLAKERADADIVTGETITQAETRNKTPSGNPIFTYDKSDKKGQ